MWFVRMRSEEHPFLEFGGCAFIGTSSVTCLRHRNFYLFNPRPLGVDWLYVCLRFLTIWYILWFSFLVFYYLLFSSLVFCPSGFFCCLVFFFSSPFRFWRGVEGASGLDWRLWERKGEKVTNCIYCLKFVIFVFFVVASNYIHWLFFYCSDVVSLLWCCVRLLFSNSW